ncbi:18443_t:CDS:1, partial [Racocetra persica]
PKTKKNFIAFGMTVALNYFNSLKEINMVPSEVVEQMNTFLKRIQVPNCEEL